MSTTRPEQSEPPAGRHTLVRRWLARGGRWLAGILLVIGTISGVMAIVAEWCGAEVTWGGSSIAAGVGFGEGYYTSFSWSPDMPGAVAKVIAPGWSARAGGPLTPTAYRLPGGGTRDSVHLGGFVWARQRLSALGAVHTIVYVQLPCWMVAVPGACVLPWWVITLYRRRKRVQAGRCRQCGYDLRATPERCPECGTRV